MKVLLLSSTQYPIDLITEAASLCYDSHPKNKPAFVDMLFNDGHLSPFEHVSFTFKISGISRACANQLVRHRLASYTQRSQRYCDETNTRFVYPTIVTTGQAAILEELFRTSQTAYSMLQTEGMSKEDARCVLPNATATELVMTMNFREFIHVCEERLCWDAQEEIRQVILKCKECLPAELQKYCRPKCHRCRKAPCDKRNQQK